MFSQVISFRTDRIDDIQNLADQWAADTTGRRTVRRSVLYRDRDQGNAYIQVVSFDSYDSAMENSALPETQAMAETMTKLVTGLEYTNYDQVRENVWPDV